MPVSRILYSLAGASIIYLRCRSLSTCSTQPSGVLICIRSAEPASAAGLHGLTIRKVYPPRMFPYRSRALLPHVFTLTRHRTGRLFSVALSRIRLGE